MADKRKPGLGKGLSALMAEMGKVGVDSPVEPSLGGQNLPIGLIDPSASQPRRHFDDVALQELADSIRIKGVLQPVLVRPATGGRYELVAGERRWRASQMAGLHDIPAVVRELGEGDSFEAALIENIQRADLNPIEEAEGYGRLQQQFGHTQDSIATLTGKSRSHIANLLRILALPDEARDMVREGRLSLGHAKAVLSAADPMALARAIVDRDMTVREAEAAARKSHQSIAPQKKTRGDGSYNADIEALELQLRDATGLKVRINSKGSAGKVVLDFSDLDQLDLIIGRLSHSASF